MRRQTSFPENFHYLPPAGWTLAAPCVLRAGKVAAAPDYRIERASHLGQDILYCLSGRGRVETLGERAELHSGQLIWIANEKPHMHAADRKRPWTLLWFRLDAPDPVGLRVKLFGDGFPRAFFADAMHLVRWFNRLFETMRDKHPAMDLKLNQLLAEFMLIVERELAGPADRDIPPRLAVLAAAMRKRLNRSWTAPELSAVTGLSQSQTRRLFRRHLHASPRKWLIRERLMRAQLLLLETDAPLASVADLCGFCDVYHLGREFKRLVGIPPATWRRSEIGAVRKKRTAGFAAA